MTTTPLFVTGQCEITPAAAAAAHAAGIDPNTLFARHERGDWGDASEWLCNENSKAAHLDRCFHAIRSFYPIDTQCECVVITAQDRTRTRLLLETEFLTRDVGVQEGYRVWAALYDLLNPLVAVEEPAVDALLATLPPITSAIDVGTGTGRLARKLACQGVPDVLGVDATPEMLVAAHAKSHEAGLSNLRFELASLGEAPLPAASNSFDLLTCGLMLCHLPDVRGAIRECIRVVRPGGLLLLTDFHPATCAFGWRTDFVSEDGIYQLPNPPHTREDYLEGLTDGGCSLLTVQDIALNGEPYGDVSDAVIQGNGCPPFCLIVLAQKQIRS